MKTAILQVALAIAVLFNVASATIINSNNSFSYFNHGSDWPYQCNTSKKQSPVDLGSKFTVPLTQISYFYYRYLPHPVWNVTWMNTTVILSASSEDDDVIGGILYAMPPGKQPLILKASQIRFRTPSEHTINGKQYPLEMQITHFPYYSQSSSDKVAVSILFEVGAQDPNLQTIVQATNNSQVTFSLAQYNLNNETDLTASYYYYLGSQTYPNCSALGWQVFEKPYTASQYQIDFFQNMFDNNTNPNFGGYHGNNRVVFNFTDPQASQVQVFYHKAPQPK